MSAWYRLSAAFDGDMDFAEMLINFHTSDSKSDAVILYKYYDAKAEFYWGEFERMLYFSTLEEYRDYYYTAHPSDRYIEKISEVYERLSKLKNKLDSVRKTYKEFKYQARTSLIELSRHYVDDELRDYKRYFIKDITLLFSYIAKLLCGIYDPFIDDRFRGYPLPNGSGSFSYNTYMYALTYNILILGVPTRVADYDNLVGCPFEFLKHDLDHESDIENGLDNKYSLYYEDIMKGEYTTDQKEACIFTMWYTIHELGRKVDTITPSMIMNNRLIAMEGDYGVKLEYSYWSEVYKILDEVNIDRNDLYESYVVNAMAYIDNKHKDHNNSAVNTTIMLAYGASLIEKLHSKYKKTIEISEEESGESYSDIDLNEEYPF